MPALVTHHLFAQETEDALPAGTLADEQERQAYELGAQGPDPLFSRWSGPIGPNHICHVLAHEMHTERTLASLEAFRAGVDALRPEDQRVGRAFALGLFAHYWLDSHVHPFVYAEEQALIEANDELAGSGSEVHAVIEADIDSWLAWLKRHEKAEDGKASQAALVGDYRLLKAAGALFSQTAFQVYGKDLDAAQYGRAVKDYRRLYRAIEPKGSMSELALTNIEELAREYSLLGALAHPAHAEAACASANTAHHIWRDPATGVESDKDFLQLFEAAKASWPKAAAAFLDGSPLAPFASARDYDGHLIEA